MTDLLGRGYVGGGSIAAVCGLSPFSTPLDAYFHIIEPEQFSDEERDFFDNRKALESYAASRFMKHTGYGLSVFNKRHDDAVFPWAKSELDAVLMGGTESLEIKTVRESMAHMWGDPEQGERAPAYVELQLQWGFGVCPWLESGYIMALVGFDNQRIYEVEKNEEAIEICRQKASDFWQFHVEKKRPPQPTTAEDLLKLYPFDSGRKVEATRDIIDAMDRITRLDNTIALHTADRTKTAFTVKDFMRDATELTQRGKVIATWKARQDGVRVFKIR